MEFERSIDVLGEDGQAKPEWEEQRSKCVVSGTTFGNCVPRGHPFKGDKNENSVIAAYACGQKVSFTAYQQTHFLDPGKEGEKLALPMFEAEFGCKLYRAGLLVCKHQPLWRGSPDGIHIDEKYIWECKTLVSRKLQFDSAGQAIVLGKHLGQAHFYMYLTGYRRCAFSQYDKDANVLHTTWLDYDEDATNLAIGYAELVTRKALAVKERVDFLADEIVKRGVYIRQPLKEDGRWMTPLDRHALHSKTIEDCLEELREIYAQYAPNPVKRMRGVSTSWAELEAETIKYQRLDATPDLAAELRAMTKQFQK